MQWRCVGSKLRLGAEHAPYVRRFSLITERSVSTTYGCRRGISSTATVLEENDQQNFNAEVETIHDDADFHRYTRGRFVQNEAAAMASRYLPFNVKELTKVAANAVGSSTCKSIEKCLDGMYNKAFLLVMDDGKEVIAKLPNPNAGLPHFTTASEVATMDFMRSTLSMPTPNIYAWCSHAEETPVGAEFIIMEKADGVPLRDMWPRMELMARYKLVLNMIKLQAAWTSVDFQGYGSIYFAKDIAAGQGLPLDQHGEDFRIGPTTGRDWFDDGRGSVLLDRGPWTSLEAYFRALGQRELKCVHEAQTLPASHITLCGPGLYQPTKEKKLRAINMYLKILPELTPQDSPATAPTIWHPDFHDENVFVDSTDPTIITSVIDWQSAEVNPLFLQARQPYILDYDGPEPDGLKQPTLPDNIHDLSPEESKAAGKLLHSQALVVVYKRLIKAEHPHIWQALRFQKDYENLLLLIGRALLVNGEALFSARVIEALDAKDSKYSITSADLGLTEADRVEIEADSEGAIRGMELLQEMEAALGHLWPEKGCVRHEHYDHAKFALRGCKEDVIEIFAKTNADHAAWNECWPYDD